MDLTFGEDFQAILVKHFRESRTCFSPDGWPMRAEHDSNATYPCRGKVVCLVCEKVIGECTIEGVNPRSRK